MNLSPTYFAIKIAMQDGMLIKLANLEQLLSMSPEAAQTLKHVLMGGAVAGPTAYLLARHNAKKDITSARNKGFGAGLAGGLMAPKVISGLNARLQGLVGGGSY